jgi:hypothetical protein
MIPASTVLCQFPACKNIPHSLFLRTCNCRKNGTIIETGGNSSQLQLCPWSGHFVVAIYKLKAEEGILMKKIEIAKDTGQCC